MVTLTKEQVDALIPDNKVGFICFMGGVGHEEDYATIYQVDDKYYLFQREEILLNTIELQEVRKLQNEESRRYTESLGG